MLNLFRRPQPDHAYHERQERLENDIAEVRGKLNNILQTVESGSREVNKRLDRLENIADILRIRGEHGVTDEKHDAHD